MNQLDRSLKVKDEVFIAVALLSQEYPDREDFMLQEIFEKYKSLGMHSAPGSFRAHVGQHTVCNIDGPNSCRYLFETAPKRRRLFRHGDPCSPSSTGSILPDEDDLPNKYHPLLEWARARLAESGSPSTSPTWYTNLLELKGSYKYTATGQSIDDYVRELRADWDEPSDE